MHKPLPEVNLLPKVERSSSRQGQIFIGMVIMLVVAYTFIGFFYFTTKANLAHEESTYAALQEENEELQAQMNTSTSTDGDNASDILSFLEGLHMRTSYLLEEVDDLLPDNSYVSEYVYQDYQAELVLHFETFDDIAQYTTSWNESPFSVDVFVDEMDAFHPREESDEEFDYYLHHIPRYETTMTIDLHKPTLRGAHVHHE